MILFDSIRMIVIMIFVIMMIMMIMVILMTMMIQQSKCICKVNYIS